MTAPLLAIDGLSKSYGTFQAIKRLDLQVLEGDVVGIIGRSGCGKSSLLRCINGLERIDEGTVRLDGKLIGRVPTAGGGARHQSERELSKQRPHIGFVFQQFNLWANKTALDNVALPQVRVLERSWGEARQTAAEMLRQLGLQTRMNAYPGELSGGQQQRVSIARALVMKPRLMLLDEPTSALDPELVRDVLDVLQDLVAQGMTMICVTHEMGFIRAFGTRLIFMDEGEIVEDGTPDQLLTQPSSERLRSLLGLITH
jgi:polar amino acid transport system ATP-binding protein